MRLRAFTIGADRQLDPLPVDGIDDACADADACVWIDFQGADPTCAEEWFDRLKVRGLARRVCLEAGDRSGFYPLPDEMILVMPVLIRSQATPTSEYVTFLCRERLLVTLHPTSVLGLHEQTTVEEATDWLPERSIVSLVAAILLDVTQECLARTSALRTAVSGLEERLDRDPDSVEADEILDLRRDLLAHEVVVSEQLPPVQALSESERPGLRIGGARDYLNCALANVKAADRQIDRLESRIAELRNGFDMHGQDRMNRRLGMLTILSAIFMPITLMAGIWGMNFESMPELGLAYGYLLALGAMALVALGMYLFFRRGGWF